MLYVSYGLPLIIILYIYITTSESAKALATMNFLHIKFPFNVCTLKYMLLKGVREREEAEEEEKKIIQNHISNERLHLNLANKIFIKIKVYGSVIMKLNKEKESKKQCIEYYLLA